MGGEKGGESGCCFGLGLKVHPSYCGRGGGRVEVEQHVALGAAAESDVAAVAGENVAAEEEGRGRKVSQHCNNDTLSLAHDYRTGEGRVGEGGREGVQREGHDV